MEMLLTIEQAATRLQLHRDTVRRHIKRGELRAFKRGRVWRVPETALDEVTKVPDVAVNGATMPREASTPETRAAAILAALDGTDMKRRNAAIIQLAKSDAKTAQIVTDAAAKAVEDYDGPEDDLSAWRNVDLKPHFPEEAPDYLDGLYRADQADEKETA